MNDFEQCLVHSKYKVNTTILVCVIALIIKLVIQYCSSTFIYTCLCPLSCPGRLLSVGSLPRAPVSPDWYWLLPTGVTAEHQGSGGEGTGCICYPELPP